MKPTEKKELKDKLLKLIQIKAEILMATITLKQDTNDYRKYKYIRRIKSFRLY